MEKNRGANPILMVIAYLSVFAVTIFLVQMKNTDGVQAASPHKLSEKSWADLADGRLSSSDSALANCRYGMTSAETTAHAVPSTGAGVFYKFNQPNWYGPLPDNGAELLHMLKTRQRKTSTGEYLPLWYIEHLYLGEELADLIREDPGAIWIVGNEVER